MAAPWTRPRKLQPDDRLNGFDCGDLALSHWLTTYAKGNQAAGMASCYLCLDDSGDVIAYYALATAGVSQLDASPSVRKGVPRHQIPAVLLARLAVHTSRQGTGLGRAMLRDALIRVGQASEIVGVRCLLIHAKDDSARRFYLRCAEFEDSPTDPLHLMLLIKDLRKSIPS